MEAAFGGGGSIARATRRHDAVPVRPIDLSSPSDKTRHDEMVALVERMLALHKQLASARTGHDQTLLQRQIGATDARTDRLVYDLYGPTDGKIAIVGNPVFSRRFPVRRFCPRREDLSFQLFPFAVILSPRALKSTTEERNGQD